MVRPFIHLLFACLLGFALPAQDSVRFRMWLGEEEAGTSVTTTRGEGGQRVVAFQEHLTIKRLGMAYSQKLRQESTRTPLGDERYTWSLWVSADPMEGEAIRKAGDPDHLTLRPKGAPEQVITVPAGALVWPEDLDKQLKSAARERRQISLQVFSFPTQQWDRWNLRPEGPDPLPGYADAIRFKGVVMDGGAQMETTSWISPTHGEVRQRMTFMGIPLWVQRADLPTPASQGDGRSFFDRTLLTLPPHPCLPWLTEVRLQWFGGPAPSVPEDSQQQWLGKDRVMLRRAQPPTALEAAEVPVTGRPHHDDAPFLAQTPLVQHQEPCFAHILTRLKVAKTATRWELAQEVTHAVFDWIRQKDLGLGLATALEVCRDARGDCTEHGVLAVALLRRLGVPARAVVGWVALEETLGLHFWVEVKLGKRWIPVDPTFDQAPASAFRIKLFTSDLKDLGSLGWDTAAAAFSAGQWRPEAPWPSDIKVHGSSLSAPGGLTLQVERGVWQLREGRLELRFLNTALAAKATLRPPSSVLEQCRLFQGARSRMQGYVDPVLGNLYVPLSPDHWWVFTHLDEATALECLDSLRVTLPDPRAVSPTGP